MQRAVKMGYPLRDTGIVLPAFFFKKKNVTYGYQNMLLRLRRHKLAICLFPLTKPAFRGSVLLV